MVKKARVKQPRRPGRKPSLNAEHVAVLHAITQEQPRSSLDEVTRGLFRRAEVKVSTVTVRKALREAGIERPAQSVRNEPGATAVARTPRPLTSLSSDCEMPWSANLLAA
jgi:transposase